MKRFLRTAQYSGEDDRPVRKNHGEDKPEKERVDDGIIGKWCCWKYNQKDSYVDKLIMNFINYEIK